MMRQTGYAIGVAVLVAVLGLHAFTGNITQAFVLGWWVMVTLSLAAMLPAWWFLRTKQSPVVCRLDDLKRQTQSLHPRPSERLEGPVHRAR